ncbi:MAG TPA: hypothetical protein VG818_02930 [Gemmatimonadaceae bacterium]|nr:hypothetical protein [Gemmatimonadaceae bacterium]
MKIFGLFALAAGAVIAASMAALMLLFPNPADRQALELAAAVGFGVHLAAFALARALRARHVWAGWIAGSLLRLATLVAFAVLVSKVWMLPLVPSLIGCATFLFLPTLIEPLLLLK